MKLLRKILIAVVLSIVLLAVLVFVFAGMPFVLDMVRSRIEHALDQQLAVKTRIGALRGNLLYRLEATQIEFGHVASIQKFSISYDLLKILRKEIDIHLVIIDGLNVDTDSIHTLMAAAEPSSDTAAAQPFPLNIQIRDFAITNSNLHGAIDRTAFRARVYLAGRFNRDRISIDTLLLATDSSSATVQGTLLLDSTFAADITYNLDIALGELGIDGLAGTIVSSGYARGDLTEPIIMNSMNIAGYYQNMLVAGTIDAYWHLPMLDSIRIDAHITAQSVPHMFQYAPDSTFDIALQVKEKAFLCDIASSSGRVRIDGLAKGDLENPDIEARVTASLQYEGLNGTAGVTGYYRNDSLNIRSLMIKTDGAVLEGHGIVSTATQRIKARAQAKIADIGLLNRFLQDTLPVSGTVSVTALVNGSLPDPRVSAEIDLNDITAFEEHITSAHFTVLYRTPRIELTDGSIRTSRGDIAVAGRYDLLDRAYSASVRTDSLRVSIPYYFGGDTVPLTAFAALDVSGRGTVTELQAEGALFLTCIVYDTLALGDLEVHALLDGQMLDLDARTGDGSLEIAGGLSLDEHAGFNARLLVHHFNLARFLPLDTGIVSGLLFSHGSLNTPENAFVNVVVDTVFIRKEKTEIKNTHALVLTMDNGKISLDTCDLRVNGHLISARGVLPTAVDIPELSLDLTTEKINVSDILLIIPDAPRINGTVQVNASVRGTMQRPVINGNLRGENLGLTVNTIVIDSVNAQLHFQNSHIVADEISGKVNKGRIRINGFADIAETGIDTMNITATIRGVDIAHPSVGNAVVSADLISIARMDSIKLSGEIMLDRGMYDVPFDHQTIINLLTRVNQPPPEQTDFVKRTYCDIGVSSTQGIAIKNNVADIGVDADLQIRGYLSRLNVYGTIATQQKGTLMYLGKKFDIERAVIQFDNPYKIDPVLDLEAASFVTADGEDYDIRLYVSGTAEKWYLELRSTPPLPEQDIISLLLLGRRRPGIPSTVTGKNAGLKGAAMEYALDLARGQIEKTGERTLGLEKLTITGDLLDPRQLAIGVEKKIARRLTVVYGTGIDSWEFHKIGINYELSDNVSISTLHDQENENSSVDLNFRFKAR